MALISVEDVVIYMSRAYDANAASTTAASAIVDGLEADLETYLKRPLVEEDVVDEEAQIDPRSGLVRLARTPVISVSSLAIDGAVQAASSYTVKAWGIKDVFYPFLPNPLIASEPVVTVSYRGGLPGADEGSAFGKKARATLKRAAARDVAQVVFEQAAGVARFSVEGTSVEFHGGVKAGAGGLTTDELKAFDRWRRRVARR